MLAGVGTILTKQVYEDAFKQDLQQVLRERCHTAMHLCATIWLEWPGMHARMPATCSDADSAAIGILRKTARTVQL